jgi:Ferritin-like domain
MDISEPNLGDLVEEVDELHREGMRTIRADLDELHLGEGRKLMSHSRRRFLAGAGLGGIGLTIGSAVVPLEGLLTPAYGQTVSDADRTLAAFAESVELAVVTAYQAAAASGKLKTTSVTTVATTFASHHHDHATAFGSAASSKATHKSNPKLTDTVNGQIQSSATEKAVLQVLYTVESAAASTYLYALGALQDNATLSLAASILPVESQHAVILGILLNKDARTNADFLPSFITQDPALTPDKYPVTTA